MGDDVTQTLVTIALIIAAVAALLVFGIDDRDDLMAHDRWMWETQESGAWVMY